MHARLVFALLIGLVTRAPATEPITDAARQRDLMVEQIRIEALLTAGESGVDTLDERILEAMREVPRHEFVPGDLARFAYLPAPLPVHPEQNLAAPFLVALMTHLAELEPGDRVFETGTGEGYHAAVLARLAREVYSVEVLPERASAAARKLDELGYRSVRVREGDGYFGWPEAAPFDAILVKEAVDHIPAPLIAQLKPGGRMVIPLGPVDGPQELTVVHKNLGGGYREERILPVRFSPLQGGERI